MKPSIAGVSALAVIVMGSFCVAADDAAKAHTSDTARSAAGAEAKSQSKAVRLTKPWKDMSSLTDDQKKQISEIHRKAVQDTKVVEQRERADIMALLNDQQKSELKTMLEKDSAERKTKAAGRTGKSGAAGDKAGHDADKDDADASGTGASDEKSAKHKAADKEATAAPAKQPA